MSQSDFDASSKSFEGDKSGDPLLPDNSNDFVLRKSRRLSCCHQVLFYISGATVILAIVLLTVTNVTLLSHKTCKSRPSIPPSSVLHCGASPKQAEALGCVFDVLDYSWTPKPCFNATLSQAYRNELISLGLAFWNDSDRSQILPNNEVFAAKHEYVFSTRILHTKHCEYFIHRQSHVLLDGLATSLMRNSTYALHCLDEILHPGDPKERLFTGFHYEKCAMGLGYLEPSLRRPPPGSLRHFVANGALNPP
jgi:hypothetical protein